MMGEQGRALEWLTSSVLMAFAITLSLPGDSFSQKGFSAFRDAGFEEPAFVFLLTLVAVSRLVALFINGAWRRSPVLRMVGACIGSAIFAALAVAFLYPTLAAGGVSLHPVSTGVSTYTVLALFDALAAHRAAGDVGFVANVRRNLKRG